MFAMNYQADFHVVVAIKKHAAKKKYDLQDLRQVEGWFAVKEKLAKWTVMYWNIEQRIEVSLLDQVVHIIVIVTRDRPMDILCPPLRTWIMMMGG